MSLVLWQGGYYDYEGTNETIQLWHTVTASTLTITKSISFENLLFHNHYTFESDLNTHNPEEGLTDVQLSEWTTEVVSDEFNQMRESSFSSRMFWVINVVVGKYELTSASLITQASQEKVIKSALSSFESQLHVFFFTRLTVKPVTLCDMWYSTLFQSS